MISVPPPSDKICVFCEFVRNFGTYLAKQCPPPLVSAPVYNIFARTENQMVFQTIEWNTLSQVSIYEFTQIKYTEIDHKGFLQKGRPANGHWTLYPP